MTNPKKLTNIAVASVLALGVIAIGAIAYQQKIQADVIVPGFATAHSSLKITIPTAETVRVKETFVPTNGSKKYYFKERDFTFQAAGLNTIEWYIRKIPAGNYNVTIKSDAGEFDPATTQVTLISDQSNDVGSFGLNLGTPIPSATPTAENTLAAPSVPAEPSASATPFASSSPSSSSSNIPTPPMPSL
jgi:hypothetical protein